MLQMRFEMNKKTIVIILAIEILISIYVCVHAWSYEMTVGCTMDDLHFEKNDDGTMEILSPMFTFDRRGIYELTISYNAGDSDADIYAMVIPERESYALDSEEIPLRYYKSSISARIYCRAAYTDAHISVHDDGIGEGELSIHNIQVRYLNRKTAVYYTSLVFFFFLVLDVIILMILGKCFAGISRESKLMGLMILGIILFINIPMYADYLPKGHDLSFHLLRISGIAEGLSQGTQFPVRIQSYWYNGYGYAVGVCYGDSLLYLPAIMYLVGYPLRQAYKFFIFLMQAFTVLGAYLCFKEISHDKRAALSGTLVYSLSIWRLTDLYTRGAVGEAAAFAFLPFVASGFWLILSGQDKIQRRRGILCLAFGYAGMIQIHVLSVIIVGVFSILLCLLFIGKLFKEKRIKDVLIGALLTCMLSIGVLVPLADYYMTLPLQIKEGSVGLIQARGVYITELLSSVLNTTSSEYIFTEDIGRSAEMPMTVGLALIMAFLLGICVLIIGGAGKYKKTLIKLEILTVLAIFMSLTFFPYDWISDNIPGIYRIIASVQFPFRYLLMASLLATMIFILFQMEMRNLRPETVRLVIMIICSISIWQALSFISNYSNGQQGYRIANDACELNEYADASEYILAGTDGGYTRRHYTIEADEGVEVATAARINMNYDLYVKNNNAKTTGLELPVFAYKGFEAMSEEGKLDITAGKNNRIRLEIPSGYKGRISVRFREPVYWRLAELCSLGSWMILFIYIILNRLTPNKEMMR